MGAAKARTSISASSARAATAPKARASRLERAISAPLPAPPRAPATPTLQPSAARRAWSGASASTVSALSSCRPSQSGPLSSHCARRGCAGARPSAGSTSASVAAGTSRRWLGGAAKARRWPLWRMLTRPCAHCCTTCPGCRGTPPAASQAKHEPSVGWPAKGSSPPGVKMRSR